MHPNRAYCNKDGYCQRENDRVPHENSCYMSDDTMCKQIPAKCKQKRCGVR
jgi:hypothetical protein